MHEKQVVGVNELLDKVNHTVVRFEKNNKENLLEVPAHHFPLSSSRRIRRGGGRPPDNRNMVFLRGRKVVKKNNSRTVLAKSTSNIPYELLDESIEGDDVDAEVDVSIHDKIRRFLRVSWMPNNFFRWFND